MQSNQFDKRVMARQVELIFFMTTYPAENMGTVEIYSTYFNPFLSRGADYAQQIGLSPLYLKTLHRVWKEGMEKGVIGTWLGHLFAP